MLSCFFVHIFGAALIYDNENAVQQQYNIVKIKILSSRESSGENGTMRRKERVENVKRRLISLLLAVCMVIGLVPVWQIEARAADSLECGVCGDNAQWTLYSSGKLVVDGSGATYSYTNPYNQDPEANHNPWSGDERISEIYINSGITSTGSFFMANIPAAENITIGRGIKTIGSYSFFLCTKLRTVYLPASVEKIDVSAFGDCCSWMDIYYEGTASQWDQIDIADGLGTSAIIHFNSYPGEENLKPTFLGTLSAVKNNTVTIDGTAYNATDAAVQSSQALLNNNKLKDRRVIYQLDDDQTVLKASSIYDALSLDLVNQSSDPGSLTYGADGLYQCNTIDLSAQIYAGVNRRSDAPFTEAELNQINKSDLWLSTDYIQANLYSTSSDIVYFGKKLWIKSDHSTLQWNTDKIYFGSGNAVTVSATADVDPNGGTPDSVWVQLRCTKVGTSDSDLDQALLVNGFTIPVVDNSSVEKKDAGDALIQSYKNANMTVALSADFNAIFSDGTKKGKEDVAALNFIVKSLELETIAAYSNADDWGTKLNKKIKNKLLKKLGISASAIPSGTTQYVYARYTGTNGKTVDLKIPVCIYTLGGKVYGSQGYVYYSTDGKKKSDNAKTWYSGGSISYVDMNNFADAMLDFVKISYDETYGKSIDKFADMVIGKPLEYLSKAIKFTNTVSDAFNLGIELPSSVSDGMFQFYAGQLKKSASIKCPVNVYVYNSLGQLCGRIENNVIDSSLSDENVALQVIGDEKYITLSNDCYSIMLVGNDNGTMEYQIDEYFNDQLLRSVVTKNIPLEENLTYCGYLPGDMYSNSENYELICEKTISQIAITDDYFVDSSKDPSISPFVDVQNTADYFYTPVLWAVENGITNGIDETRFAPNQSCTRAQVVTFLWRAMGSPEPTSTDCPFEDVAEGKYYYKAVLWAVENGITTGKSATRFAPKDTITRAEFVTFLWRAQGKPGHSTSNPFWDVPSGSYYYDAVLWAVENGITTGKTTEKFAPKDPCTRGQVVTFLYRDLG